MRGLSEALSNLERHWAVAAIAERDRERARAVNEARLIKKAVGRQIEVDFAERPDDDDFLRKLALAYELAAIEGIEAFLNPTSNDDSLRNQCIAGAWRSFEIRRLWKIPEGVEEKIFHTLHLSALAYCGERWPDLRRWFCENEGSLAAPSVAEVQWDKRLLFRLLDCWRRLFRKQDWDDLDRIREIIAGLRQDQLTYEESVLSSGTNEKDQAMALRLVALYHFAKATELLATYMLQGEPAAISTQLDQHFEMGERAAASYGDSQFEVLLKWLHAAARRMVAVH